MLTAQVESMIACLDEMKPLFTQHYDDLSLHKGRHDLDPNFQAVAQIERNGELLMVSLRKDGAMIGYFVGKVAPGMHYQSCLTLIMDMFFIAPEHRGGHGALRLFRCVEREARRRGVHLWFCGTKLHKDAGRLFSAIGMEPVEMTYAKWLRD